MNKYIVPILLVLILIVSSLNLFFEISRTVRLFQDTKDRPTIEKIQRGIRPFRR